MRYIKLLAASVISVMLVSMSACVADKTELEMLGYIKTINVVGPDKIAFEPISGVGQTKATSVDDGIALVFNWAAGDTLGIFPNKGGQVEFPITTQESSTSASFDGGGWALRNNASYAAYYPFNRWNCFQDNKTIILDYSGQVQNGNGSFAHLSAYDYLASAKTTPENNMVTFQMDRQGSILYIDIVVPEPATITSLTISCDEAIFVEKAALDISGDTPEVTPIETKESLTLAFENTATTTQYETVRAYMAVQPVDFSAKTVTATLRTSAGIYTAPVVSRVVNKGKAAFLRFSDSFTDSTIHGAVDLGLTSGLKWATCNVGASAPEEYGDYFAWGETEPYYSSQDPLTWKDGKTGYNWASYKWCNGTYKTQTKYCTDSSYGTVDNKTVLDPENDAAAVNWGSTWRMPTDSEWTELRTECTWTWTSQNGVTGRLVTGPNGNSIFLPATGFLDNTYLNDTGSGGYYWSSSLYTDDPYYAYSVGDVYRYDYNFYGRIIGYSVRPVTDEGVRVSVTGVSLNKSSLDLVAGGTASLSATVTPSNATQPTLIWSSSNTSVATVDYNGVVTAVSTGSAIITATTYDGGFTAACTVNVRQGAVVEGDPFDVGSDLSVNGTANCYVVPKAGEFSFDASVMGNGPEGYIWEQTQGTDMHLWPYHREEVYFSTNDVLPSQAFVIWDDNEVITDVVYNSETKRISFTATGNKGNALIGLFDSAATETGAQQSSDLALWSWHIWCTDSPKRFIQYDNKEDDYEILDRNLGATSADPADGEATYGYFYQFGRKDPIKGYDGIAGDQKKAQQELKHSVNHPTYFYKLNTKTKEWFNDGKSSLATVCADLWGNPAWQFASTANIHPYQALRSELRKTIYDPCPPGYMVPPETAWTGIDAESIVILDNGVLIPTASGDSFYPFAGYISDLNSWENDSMGYYAYNGCTITGSPYSASARVKRAARVYSSYTGLDSEWQTFDIAPNHFGGCSLSLHIGDGDPIDYDHLVLEPMYQSNRQRGHNVRCVREFNK